MASVVVETKFTITPDYTTIKAWQDALAALVAAGVPNTTAMIITPTSITVLITDRDLLERIKATVPQLDPMNPILPGPIGPV